MPDTPASDDDFFDRVTAAMQKEVEFFGNDRVMIRTSEIATVEILE